MAEIQGRNRNELTAKRNHRKGHRIMKPQNLGQASRLPLGNTSQARRLRYMALRQQLCPVCIQISSIKPFPGISGKVGPNT
jgi:hypothetical protein